MAHILLAEDEPVLRMLILDTLEDEGHKIDVACDGEEAIHKLKTNKYDLVLLDYMMPKMSGIEVIEYIRLHCEKGEVKILMLSAKNQQSEQQKALSTGADAFLSKPFSPMKLIDQVEEMLK